MGISLCFYVALKYCVIKGAWKVWLWRSNLHKISEGSESKREIFWEKSILDRSYDPEAHPKVSGNSTKGWEGGARRGKAAEFMACWMWDMGEGGGWRCWRPLWTELSFSEIKETFQLVGCPVPSGLPWNHIHSGSITQTKQIGGIYLGIHTQKESKDHEFETGYMGEVERQKGKWKGCNCILILKNKRNRKLI